jgi:hypothetical protein
VQTSLKLLIADQPPFSDRWFLDPVDCKFLLTLPYFLGIIDLDSTVKRQTIKSKTYGLFARGQREEHAAPFLVG